MTLRFSADTVTKMKNLTIKQKNNLFGWLFVSPIIIGFCLFGAIPIVYSIVMAFGEYSFFTPYRFVEFQNFSRVLHDRVFLLSIRNALIALCGVPLSIVVSILVARLLSCEIKGQPIFRTFFYIPGLCSTVAISVVWRTIYNEQFGVLNSFLSVFGIPNVGWLTDSRFVMIALIIQGVWMGIGGGMVLYLAAIKGVPREYYEAAKISGASNTRMFFTITLPMISPTTFYIGVTSTISTLQDFTRYKIMTNGGPEYGSMMPALYCYQAVFNYSDLGYGFSCAMGWFFGLIIMAITVSVFFVGGKFVNYDY